MIYLHNYFTEDELESGIVKNWDSAKGFGFITTSDDDDLFVHMSDLHVTIRNKRLTEGQHVKFDLRSDMKGDRAINVRLAR